MNTVRISLVSLALCTLFASFPVRANDCGDALIAESCACRADAKSDRAQHRSSDKKRASKTARLQVPQRSNSKIVPEQSQAGGNQASR